VGDEVVVQREYIYGAGELLASVSTETGLPPIGISFLTPTTGQSFPSLQAFNLTSRVTAPAEATVLRVEYFLDGLLVGSSTDAANGYPVPWNNSAVALTTYRFRARVVLADGRAASSDLLSITIY